MAPVRPILRSARITEQQWRVLRVLIDEGATDVSTLSVNSLLRPPSVTRILRELTRRGLIQRIIDPFDARRSIVSVTPLGRQLVDSTTGAMLNMLDRYAAAFGADRLFSLRSELALFIETIGPADITSDDD
jgi:homoprotocatechuate degradation regulator HpaR